MSEKTPTCPVDAFTKEWVEDSLHWLESAFAKETLANSTVVQPTPKFFPEDYERSLEGARTLLAKTASYIGTSPDGTDVRLVPQRDELWLTEDRASAGDSIAGNDSPGVITYAIEQNDLAAPEELVGLFARELSALRLIEDVSVNPDSYDFGQLADLAATYLGLGIFVGALTYVAPETSLTGKRMTPYTLPPPATGYALAHVAWHTGETKPDWFQFLKPDVYATASKGLDFLLATGESEYRPAAVGAANA